MPNIPAIIKALDEYMDAQHKQSIAPPEANAWLERKGLLSDSKQAPGLPLRNLLRVNKLPHAYQVGGKYSKWVIPRSKSK